MASSEPALSQSDRSRPRLPPAQVDCKWWKQGDCFRGSTCYFRHDPAVKGLSSATKGSVEAGSASITQEKCAICLETPRTFGLLVKCDHVFCFECVKNWRGSADDRTSSSNASLFMEDTRGLKKTSKTCPICRTHSDFVVPSAVFPTISTSSPDPEARSEAKQQIISNYLARIKLIPCRYFQKSVEGQAGSSNLKPSCRFGNECQYRHAHPVTSEPYVFSPAELDAMRERPRRNRRRGPVHGSLERISAFDIDMMLLQLVGLEVGGMTDDDDEDDYDDYDDDDDEDPSLSWLSEGF